MDPDLVQRGRLEVLDEHVGLLDETHEQLARLGTARVQRAGQLVAGDGVVHRVPVVGPVGVPGRGRCVHGEQGAEHHAGIRPRQVALRRRREHRRVLDPDHLGAEIGEELGEVRPGPHRGEVEHPHAVQRRELRDRLHRAPVPVRRRATPRRPRRRAHRRAARRAATASHPPRADTAARASRACLRSGRRRSPRSPADGDGPLRAPPPACSRRSTATPRSARARSPRRGCARRATDRGRYRESPWSPGARTRRGGRTPPAARRRRGPRASPRAVAASTSSTRSRRHRGTRRWE